MAGQYHTQGTVRFNLRIDKTDVSGKSPIELVYSLHGQRKYINTGLKLYPISWDAKKQAAVYLSKPQAKALGSDVNYESLLLKSEVDQCNLNLGSWVLKVQQSENSLKLSKVQYTSADIANYLRRQKDEQKSTKRLEPSIYVSDFIRDYIKENSASAKKATIKVYNTLLSHVENYENNVVVEDGEKVSLGRKRGKITFENAGLPFFRSFYNYLLGDVGHLNATAAKQITGLKTFMAKAYESGYKVNETYKNMKVKNDKLDVLTLTKAEFDAIRNLDLSSNARLDKARDLFVFACVTGLRYSDLANLRHENIMDGYLSITVVKTKQKLEVPLMGMAYDILSKYHGAIKPLPSISNQKLNDYIKEVAKLAEINNTIPVTRFRGNEEITVIKQKWELVTVHMARRVFVTLSLEFGMKAEEIMPITGHVSYQAFKRYLNVTKEHAKKALIKAWDQPQLKVVNGGGE